MLGASILKRHHHKAFCFYSQCSFPEWVLISKKHKKDKQRDEKEVGLFFSWFIEMQQGSSQGGGGGEEDGKMATGGGIGTTYNFNGKANYFYIFPPFNLHGFSLKKKNIYIHISIHISLLKASCGSLRRQAGSAPPEQVI